VPANTRSTSERFFCALLAAAHVLAVAPRVAMAAPPPEAHELKTRGDAAMDAGRYADALAHYREAYSATQSPALLYNMGRAYQRLGHYTEALAYFEQFDGVASPDLRSRVPRLDALIAEVKARLATLTVKCNVVGARVLVRGKWTATTPVRAPILLMAGATDVEIEADGYAAQKKQLMLVEGRTTAIDATLVPVGGGGQLARLVVRSGVTDGDVCVDTSCHGKPPVTVPVEAGLMAVVSFCSHGMSVAI
jgi:tetratricopeptide (TPR) repeat protein